MIWLIISVVLTVGFFIWAIVDAIWGIGDAFNLLGAFCLSVISWLFFLVFLQFLTALAVGSEEYVSEQYDIVEVEGKRFANVGSGKDQEYLVYIEKDGRPESILLDPDYTTLIDSPENTVIFYEKRSSNPFLVQDWLWANNTRQEVKISVQIG